MSAELPDRWILVHASEMPQAGSGAWPRTLVPASPLVHPPSAQREAVIAPLAAAAVDMGAAAFVTSTHLLSGDGTARDDGVVVAECAIVRIPGRRRPLGVLLAGRARYGAAELPSTLLLRFCETEEIPELVAALHPPHPRGSAGDGEALGVPGHHPERTRTGGVDLPPVGRAGRTRTGGEDEPQAGDGEKAQVRGADRTLVEGPERTRAGGADRARSEDSTADPGLITMSVWVTAEQAPVERMTAEHAPVERTTEVHAPAKRTTADASGDVPGDLPDDVPRAAPGTVPRVRVTHTESTADLVRHLRSQLVEVLSALAPASACSMTATAGGPE